MKVALAGFSRKYHFQFGHVLKIRRQQKNRRNARNADSGVVNPQLPQHDKYHAAIPEPMAADESINRRFLFKASILC